VAGGPEQRIHPRFDVKAQVEIVRGGGARLRCMTRNVSKGGVCLDAPVELVSGENIDVLITLVFDANRSTEPLALPARVMWSTAIGKTHQVGTQFRQLTVDQSTYLDLFLRYLAQAADDGDDDDDSDDDDPFR
jgi:hypothetical protein